MIGSTNVTPSEFYADQSTSTDCPPVIAGYEIHPFAQLFPMMGDPEIVKLAADIDARGLNEPVVLFKNAILDGRNRAIACERLGIVPHTVAFEGSTDADALAFVASKNLCRRHLSASQRAMIAADIANIAHGGDRRSDQAASLPVDARIPVTQAQAADAMQASERSVREAAFVKKNDPFLAEQVRVGKISVSGAAGRVRKAQRPTAPKAAKPTPHTTAEELLDRMSEVMLKLREARLGSQELFKAAMLARDFLVRILPLIAEESRALIIDKLPRNAS